MLKGLLLIFIFCFCSELWSQSPFAEHFLKYDDNHTYALRGVKIVQGSGEIIDNATLVWRYGKIIACSREANPPKGSVIFDGKGLWVYPGFIDLWSDYGLPEEPKKEKSSVVPYDSDRLGPVGNYESNRANYEAAQFFHPQPLAAENYRKAGITTLLTHKTIGNIRGTAALVGTGIENPSKEILKSSAAFIFSLDKTSHVKQFYPTSLAGAIALIRQTFYDAEWYKRSGAQDQYFVTLERFSQSIGRIPLICEVQDKYDIFKMEKVAREFGVKFVYKGCGNEYQRAPELAKTGATIVIPLKMVEGWQINHALESEELPFNTIKHWELAPYNAKILFENKIPFAFTSFGLKKPEETINLLRQIVKKGLPKSEAIKAFTENPARFVRESERLGQLKPGYVANFFVTSGDIFEEGEMIYYTVVRGKPYLIQYPPIGDLRGIYRWESPELSFKSEIKISGHPLTLEAVSKVDKIKKATISLEFNKLLIKCDLGKDSLRLYEFFATIDKDSLEIIRGYGLDSERNRFTWKLVKEKTLEPPQEKTKKDSIYSLKIPVPFSPYGIEPVPERYDFVVRGSTVWTNENDGILSETDVHVKNGKIHAIGKNLAVPSGVLEIDGKNKHLTCGIIDEHSHIALTRGVNEWGSNASAEVRMYDAVFPDDEDIYRQLAGGVTAAQLLHGSANPIGGQSALVKFRWGAIPEHMKIVGAPKFIKFALGENVKQGNDPSEGYRYPQSRMGVEATYYYYFLKAKKYAESIKNDPLHTRKDLRLETLAEILNKKCFITCHSYVQSEINMLMKLADSLGFKVNTFTHILEGYKVADKMKAHGVNASSFSDWWAYKWEVMEAIPYNPAILIKMGVNTAINSDDPEMARRLNQEAAKVVKYGGISEEEAWKTVTLNPAKMLHLDNLMGSIKIGKDADLVLWTDNPLSIYSKPIYTWVDGHEMFSLERDQRLRTLIREERKRILDLIQKDTGPKKEVERPKTKHYHCDTLDEAWEVSE